MTDEDERRVVVGSAAIDGVDLSFGGDDDASMDVLWLSQRRVLSVLDLDLDSETMRVVLGIDPSRLAEGEPSFAAQVKARVVRPPVAPRKRRGLTGKRYRIARRRYAREMKAWSRGQWGAPVEVHYYLPRLRIIDQTAHTVKDVHALAARFSTTTEANHLPDQR